jgi:flagellar FliL protein
MATAAAKPAVPAAAAAPAAETPKKSKLLLVVVLVLVLVSAGAGTAWWFLHQAEDQEEEEVPSKPSIFLPIDQFTVNLQAEEGQQQFLQLSMTLSVADVEVAEAIKGQMPQVRSRVLFLLSSKKPSQLASLEGKNALTQELIREVEAVLPPAKGKKHKKADDDEDAKAKKGKAKKAKAKAKDSAEDDAAPHRVLAVYFTHFIVQ